MAHRKEYQNFDVVIEKSGEEYRARVINSPCGQAAIAFEKPLSPFELKTTSYTWAASGAKCVGIVTIW